MKQTLFFEKIFFKKKHMTEVYY